MNLDAWLPDPDIRSRHRRAAPGASDAELWQAAEGVRIGETRALGRLVRWRIPGTQAQTTYRDLFRSPPFLELEEGPTWSVSGLAGRIWTLERDYPRLTSPDEFRDWDARGTARVLFAHWVEDGALHSESRVQATSAGAGVRLRALWAVVGRFERLIGGEALALAARRAAR
jgi:hypothetical protein